MAFGSMALKSLVAFIYMLCFCCAAIILGVYSYFLSVQADHKQTLAPIRNWERAVEGIAGIGVAYAIIAIVLTCFLGGKAFFAFLGIFLDVLLTAGFVAIAIMTRDGAGKCTGNDINSPIGNGASNSKTGYGSGGFGTTNSHDSNLTYASTLGFACRLNKVAFAVAVIGAFLFLFAALTQLWLARHHKREKRLSATTAPAGKRGWFGRKRGARGAAVAPAAGYTGKSGGRWFGKRNRQPVVTDKYSSTHHDTELGTIPAADTSYHHQTHDANANAAIPTAGGYHTGPAGTSVNPYGYDNGHTTTARY
ncbi:hypothetical protein EJ06DRAFT_578172, partial [Trichodelitschia bisporula]